jgi:hypothetical protein
MRGTPHVLMSVNLREATVDVRQTVKHARPPTPPEGHDRELQETDGCLGSAPPLCCQPVAMAKGPLSTRAFVQEARARRRSGDSPWTHGWWLCDN